MIFKFPWQLFLVIDAATSAPITVSLRSAAWHRPNEPISTHSSVWLDKTLIAVVGDGETDYDPFHIDEFNVSDLHRASIYARDLLIMADRSNDVQVILECLLDASEDAVRWANSGYRIAVNGTEIARGNLKDLERRNMTTSYEGHDRIPYAFDDFHGYVKPFLALCSTSLKIEPLMKRIRDKGELRFGYRYPRKIFIGMTPYYSVSRTENEATAALIKTFENATLTRLTCSVDNCAHRPSGMMWVKRGFGKRPPFQVFLCKDGKPRPYDRYLFGMQCSLELPRIRETAYQCHAFCGHRLASSGYVRLLEEKKGQPPADKIYAVAAAYAAAVLVLVACNVLHNHLPRVCGPRLRDIRERKKPTAAIYQHFVNLE